MASLRRTIHVMARGVDIHLEDRLSLDLDGDVLLTIADITMLWGANVQNLLNFHR